MWYCVVLHDPFNLLMHVIWKLVPKILSNYKKNTPTKKKDCKKLSKIEKKKYSKQNKAVKEKTSKIIKYEQTTEIIRN